MAGAPFGVLVVCRANECRSPATAALLREAVESAAAPIVVRSGGIMARSGHPADPVMAALIGRRGIDLRGHASRAVDRVAASDADLVIAASRAHLRVLVGDLGAPFRRSFTLRELARRAASIDPRYPDERRSDWLDRIATGRSPSELIGRDADDDLADPTGFDELHYLRCLAQIERSVSVICERGLLGGP